MDPFKSILLNKLQDITEEGIKSWTCEGPTKHPKIHSSVLASPFIVDGVQKIGLSLIECNGKSKFYFELPDNTIAGLDSLFDALLCLLL